MNIQVANKRATERMQILADLLENVAKYKIYKIWATRLHEDNKEGVLEERGPLRMADHDEYRIGK